MNFENLSSLDKAILVRKLELEKKANRIIDVGDFLTQKQLQIIRDPSPFKAILAPRRSGKTRTTIFAIIETALKKPDSVIYYIAQEKLDAMRIIWKDLTAVLLEQGICEEKDMSEHHARVRFANGSELYVGGVKDKTEIPRYKGTNVALAILDEAQNFTEGMIKQLIDESLGPATMLVRGEIWVCGTPSLYPKGDWYNIAHDGLGGFKRFRIELRDNPLLLGLGNKKDKQEAKKLGIPYNEFIEQKVLNNILIEKGWTKTNPTYRREYLCEWVRDKEQLQYDYDEVLNHFDELPDLSDYNFILGVDFGASIDSDAVAVVAYSQFSGMVYLVEEFIDESKQDLTDFAEVLKELIARYNPQLIVADNKALARKLIEEIRNRHGIHMEAAEQMNKADGRRLLNSDLHRGKIKIQATTRLANDMMLLRYDLLRSTEKKMVEDRQYHSDIADAFLYAYRACRHYILEQKDKVIQPNSKEFYEKEEQEMLEVAIMENDEQLKFYEEVFKVDDIFGTDEYLFGD